MSKELELEATTWEKEKTKWVVVLAQMNDVQKFGVMKFLTEKLVENLDDNVLYIQERMLNGKIISLNRVMKNLSSY